MTSESALSLKPLLAGGGCCGASGSCAVSVDATEAEAEAPSSTSAPLSYSREPLLILPVRGSTGEAILEFLNSHSGDSYHLVEDFLDSSDIFYVRGSRNPNTTIGLPDYSFIVFDPELAEVSFIQSPAGLYRLGVNPDRLTARLAEATS